MPERTGIRTKTLLKWMGISQSKYYAWRERQGTLNQHKGTTPLLNEILPWERKAIIDYARTHPEEGYRRLTYMMLDEDIVALSPSTTYRVLKSAGLFNLKKGGKANLKKTGFDQPKRPHEQWHTDIKYVNFQGTFLFLISVIDGYSRYIVHHELRTSMEEYDVEITLQRALEKYPQEKPRLISDNGSQYISKDFAQFLRLAGLQHTRTSLAYPQSNGKIERFHQSLKQECLRKRSLIDLMDARKQIGEYIDYYNRKRLHSALFYLTPEDFLTGKVEERLKAREQKLRQAKWKRMEVNHVA
ncbi:MAG: IS3 family transposase [bacterium]